MEKEIKIEILNNGILINKPKTIKNGIEILLLKHEVYYLSENHTSYKKNYNISNVYIITISSKDDPRIYEIVISKKLIDPDKPIKLDDLNKIIINIDLSKIFPDGNYRFEDAEYLLLLVDKNDIAEEI